MNKRTNNSLDIMLDLETLGTDNSPTIMQISAVAFNIATGETYGEFNEFVRPQSCVKHGLKSSGDTLDWWLQQEQEVIKKVFIESISNGKELPDVLDSFSNWILALKGQLNARSVEVWGNGALADNKWIISAFTACKKPVPWRYNEDRDVRTLVSLGQRILNIDPKKNLPFDGMKHDAIADCKNQIKYCHEIYKAFNSLSNPKKSNDPA